MKVRAHQHKRMSREVRTELDVGQCLAEDAPARLARNGPPGPVGESGIEMEKTLRSLKTSRRQHPLRRSNPQASFEGKSCSKNLTAQARHNISESQR